jgi:hypothetical protein
MSGIPREDMLVNDRLRATWSGATLAYSFERLHQTLVVREARRKSTRGNQCYQSPCLTRESPQLFEARHAYDFSRSDSAHRPIRSSIASTDRAGIDASWRVRVSPTRSR